MPVDFPTLAQRERYGRHPDIVSTAPARYFHLDDDALYRVARKRRDSGRLGYELRLTTARFLDDPTAVPAKSTRSVQIALELRSSARPHCRLTNGYRPEGFGRKYLELP